MLAILSLLFAREKARIKGRVADTTSEVVIGGVDMVNRRLCGGVDRRQRKMRGRRWDKV